MIQPAVRRCGAPAAATAAAGPGPASECQLCPRAIVATNRRSCDAPAVIREYSVASLLLDETNPRFADGVDSQREAVNALLSDAPAKLLKLAGDIAREGTLNPTELPVVVREANGLVVIEGNRRLAAVKLLANPELAFDKAHQRSLQRIAKTGAGPTKVTCYLAESRAAARHWLKLRHTGENGGVGVVEWKPWQMNNFDRRRGTQTDRATIFCDAVSVAFPDEVELLANVEAVRRGRITTLGRLLGDPAVRDAFGFDFSGDGVVFHFANLDLLPGLQKIFRDFAGDLGVSDIKGKPLRAAYIEKSSDALPPRVNRLPVPRPAAPQTDDATAGDIPTVGQPPTPGPLRGSETPAAGTPTDRAEEKPVAIASDDGVVGGPPTPRRTTPRQERVIFEGLKLTQVDLRTSKLLAEAQSIDIETMPAVAGVLVRVVVELAVTDAVVRRGWGTDNDKLKRKIGMVLLQLDPLIKDSQRRDKDLEPAWVRTQDDGLVVQTMHAFVHNISANPTAAEVRELSRTFRPMLNRLDAYLAANPLT